jgi:hypothetical protein
VNHNRELLKLSAGPHISEYKRTGLFGLSFFAGKLMPGMQVHQAFSNAGGLNPETGYFANGGMN